ncbi:ABC transporter ATP-binding protein [Hydrogenophaga laconesensis]|uniref:Branched-chain amino acid transport system ATP-binding protein n=1 Tax=Hydrogenophaga laconesensis TaxID=1805971 RepID=A0ABU1VBA3_9BURK|nr:ABC transporter ATP-binding protein [Hydrogenophaga laconesensis]MDR7094766.1 branched-chain amino acid transport system ATP-binding protein [Hydrogenophaga laconesensis]
MSVGSEVSNAVSEPLIALNNVEVLYADVILSLKGITLQVASGGCTVLLGPNGAGKSTTLKTISGMLDVEEGRVASGNVRMLGKDITGVSAEQMVAEGVVHVVEGRKVLRHMTAEQNLVVGGHRLTRMADVKQGLERVYGLIPRLAELRTRTAGYLSGGEQQLLLIGRAMMARPRLLMIDEPSLGLAPLMVKEIFDLLGKLRAEGVSLLIVEQHAQAALELADHGYILENGRVVLEGTAAELRANEDIQEFYLGNQASGERKNYREVKHYRRRKRWLG